MAERILYIDAAVPPAPSVPVAVLKIPNSESEPLSYALKVGIHVRPCRGSCAVSASSHRKNKRRRDQVSELEADVIYAVPEGWRLDELAQRIAGQAMLLREYRVRHFDVLVLHSGVAEHHADLSLPGEEILICSSDVLNRCRVAIPWIQGHAGCFDPNPPEKHAAVVLQHAYDQIEVGDGVVALAAAASKKPTDILAFDFGQDMVEVVPGPRCLSPEESALHLEELPGQAGDLIVRDDHRHDYHQRSRISSGSWIFNPA